MKFLLVNCVIISLAVSFGTSLSVTKVKKLNEKYNIHAVVVAGSNTYDNYRHQANACHAYHVLRKHGVPAENIILMMYDDVASSRNNPYPGKLFNVPGGPDVYEGCNKDYTGDDVKPETFMKVLKADKDLAAQGKKVLTSGPNDHVFIYFTDHGGSSTIYFPKQGLTSDELSKTFTYMHENSLYGKLTLYLEACESGSMLDGVLPDNINIYATSSTDDEETGWATYCDVPKFDTCLSDEYSAAWMADTEAEDISKETLETQFQKVKAAVKKSKPREFGQKSLASLDVGQFQGESKSPSKTQLRRQTSTSLVNSREVPLYNLNRRLARARANSDKTEVEQLEASRSNLISGRSYFDLAIRQIITELCQDGFCSNTDDVLGTHLRLRDHKTYSKVFKTFESKCINVAVNYYGTRYMYALSNIVQMNNFNEASLERFTDSLERACAKHFNRHDLKAIV